MLFLDEPTAGLDVASRVELHSLMRELQGQGATILLATHDMAEAEALANRLAIRLMMPFAILPPGAQTLAWLLPATYAMNAYNGLSYGLETPFSAGASLLILLAGGLLAFGLALLLFNWDRQNRTARLHPAFGLLAALPYALGMTLL